MLETFVSATEIDRIIMLEKTNFNLDFLKTIVEMVSDSSVLQVRYFRAVVKFVLGTIRFSREI
jgi:hypothetical protein